jgi:hypothetical protein
MRNNILRKCKPVITTPDKNPDDDSDIFVENSSDSSSDDKEDEYKDISGVTGADYYNKSMKYIREILAKTKQEAEDREKKLDLKDYQKEMYVIYKNTLDVLKITDITRNEPIKLPICDLPLSFIGNINK